MSDWSERLWTFAEIYAGMEDRICANIKMWDDESLRQFIKDADQPETNNCWWAVYRVAPIVKRFAMQEITRREWDQMNDPMTRDQVCALRWDD